MKSPSALLLALLLLAGPASAVDRGATPEAVRAELGEPDGQLLLGARLLYTYARGEVEFISNAVVRAELISAEQLHLRQAAQTAEAERQRAWADARRELRLQEGQTALARLREDASFPLRPAAEQVAWWQSFRQRYPELGVDASYSEALRRMELEEREQRVAQAERQRLTDLERRVADAEARAAEAERATRRRSYTYDCGPRYPVYVPYPVSVVRRDCAPAPRERPRVCAPVTPSVTIRLGSSTELTRSSCSLVRGNVALVRN
jgi:hypothetical protein